MGIRCEHKLKGGNNQGTKQIGVPSFDQACTV